MIEIGAFRAGSCEGLTRRSFVQAATCLPLVPGLASLASRARAAESSPRAKSIILLWLWGGPSHLDTFDPKPDAPSRYRGSFSTIPTRVPGIHFTELFPELAKRNDRFALVRSHYNHDNGHLNAGNIGLTGDRGQGGRYGPNFGSIISRSAREHGSAREGAGAGRLPPFVSVGRNKLRDAGGFVKGIGGGTWGTGYDPFHVTCSDEGQVDIPALKLPEGLSVKRLERRRRLLDTIDQIERTVESVEFDRWDKRTQSAYALLSSAEGRRAFDLAQEPDELRDRYGRSLFGQSCLLARRLAEVEVPFIQVNWSEYVEPYLGDRTDYGWDTHANHFELMNDRHGPILDRALSALLDDLGDRGLLENTLVLTIGEFGRTPGINGNMSRDHWNRCYSSIWAGAGVAPGRVVGESSARGEDPITPRITPDMVGTTLCELAGVSAELRAEYRVLPNSRVIHELF